MGALVDNAVDNIQWEFAKKSFGIEKKRGTSIVLVVRSSGIGGKKKLIYMRLINTYVGDAQTRKGGDWSCNNLLLLFCKTAKRGRLK